MTGDRHTPKPGPDPLLFHGIIYSLLFLAVAVAVVLIVVIVVA